jgi:hypothetical protein
MTAPHFAALIEGEPDATDFARIRERPELFGRLLGSAAFNPVVRLRTNVLPIRFLAGLYRVEVRERTHSV